LLPGPIKHLQRVLLLTSGISLHLIGRQLCLG
jgi:hypothetical protein